MSEISSIPSIEESIIHLSDTNVTEVLLYGKPSLYSLENSRIIIIINMYILLIHSQPLSIFG